jgi:N-acetylmuramoyl-L-alanine amidase
MEKNRRQFLRRLAGMGGAATLSAMPFIARAAAETHVRDIRLSTHKGYVRLVFDLDKSVDHSVFSLNKPERIVLDLKNTKMNHGMVDRVGANSLIRRIRSGVRDGNDLRVVFDLQKEVKPRSFVLGPSGKSGHRLVLDLHNESASAPVASKPAVKKQLRDVIVAIDAGHGAGIPAPPVRKAPRKKRLPCRWQKGWRRRSISKKA